MTLFNLAAIEEEEKREGTKEITDDPPSQREKTRDELADLYGYDRCLDAYSDGKPKWLAEAWTRSAEREIADNLEDSALAEFHCEVFKLKWRALRQSLKLERH